MKYREYTVIPVNEGIKIVKGNEEKTVNVVDCTEFRYKLTKSKIYAAGGPGALVAWMEEDISLFECMVRKVLDFAWYEMKEMRETK